MKRKMRREAKIGLLCYVVFQLLHMISLQVKTENSVIHFLMGFFVGLAIVMMLVGFLPDASCFKIICLKKRKHS